MEYIARFSDYDKERKQPLIDHLRNVAIIAANNGKKLGMENTLFLAGRLHDMGKYSDDFQHYIEEQRTDDKGLHTLTEKVDHGVYGGKYIYEKFHGSESLPEVITAEIITWVCCCHHGGLRDSETKGGEAAFQERFEKITDEQMKIVETRFLKENTDFQVDNLFSEAISEVSRLLKCRSNFILKSLENKNAISSFMSGLLIKAAYSMLIDADRLDSYNFDEKLGLPDFDSEEKEKSLFWPEMTEKLKIYMTGLENKSCSTEREDHINHIRNEIHEDCVKAADEETRLRTLTVPTGGGKTLSSLDFALNYAMNYGKDRIIYVLPFTTIIEQNADTVRNALNCGEQLFEHHSNIMEEKKSEHYDVLTQRWESRIIFTTMVQFLDTFYGHGTRDMRRLHNLLNSVIIFDEVQAVPIKCISLFNQAINFLYNMGGTATVLSSATQPALGNTEAPILGLSPKNEMMVSINSRFKQMERVKVEDATKTGKYSVDEAASFILKKKEGHSSLLAVFNTKKAALEVWRKVKIQVNPSTKVIFLSTGLCPAHRKNIIEELRKDLVIGKDLICISTQLIEAGVDISFQVGIRSLAGLDSIAQAAGRVNRNGELEEACCYVINLDDTEENTTGLSQIHHGKIHGADLLHTFAHNPKIMGGSLLSTESISNYYYKYYADKRICDVMDYPTEEGTIFRMLCNHADNISCFISKHGRTAYPLWAKFRLAKAGESFSVIEKNTVSVVVPYGDGEKLIERLFEEKAFRSLKDCKELISKLQQFSVNVYENKKRQLIKEEALTLTSEGIYILNKRFYDEEIGVTLDKKNLDYLIM